jgi:predicted ATPase
VSLRYKQDEGGRTLGSLELTKEELEHITLRDATEHLPFRHSREWRNRAVTNRRRTPKYISTEGSGQDRVINVHQDGGSSGKPQKLRAANLPRTVVSAANSAESPTATLVKREMQSWRMLQLEPSSLREPDNFTSPTELSSDGGHLPAAMFHLAHASNGSPADPDAVYTEIANRVSELIDDVRGVSVDRDEPRQLLTVSVTGQDGTIYPARALSDGTLRFLALAVLAIDPDSQGLVCMEEPENGIHPERIPAMIRLLRDLATDTEAEERESGTALRQVIVNTHSPAVVLQVPEDSLVMAESIERTREGTRFKALHFRCLADTWRANHGMGTIPKGQLLAYLNPVSQPEDYEDAKHLRRVIDSGNLRQLRLDFVASEGPA